MCTRRTYEYDLSIIIRTFQHRRWLKTPIQHVCIYVHVSSSLRFADNFYYLGISTQPTMGNASSMQKYNDPQQHVREVFGPNGLFVEGRTKRMAENAEQSANFKALGIPPVARKPRPPKQPAPCEGDLADEGDPAAERMPTAAVGSRRSKREKS